MIDLECISEACSILTTEIFYCLEDLYPIERLQFYCTIALLYKRMGMSRKYCYFLRQVALESMSMDPKLKPHMISFAILKEVLEKYGVVPGDHEQQQVGWPRLQVNNPSLIFSSSPSMPHSPSQIQTTRLSLAKYPD